MEHEDEGQASTAFSRAAVVIVECAIAAVIAGIVVGLLIAIVEVGQ